MAKDKKEMEMIDDYSTEYAASLARACRKYTDKLDAMSDWDMVNLFRDIQLMFAAGK